VSTGNQYLSLPIIPGVGAAGIQLGDTREDVLKKIGKPLYIRYVTALHGRDRVFQYEELAVRLAADRVIEINLFRSYVGTTKEGLRPGASWEELKRTYPDVVFDEPADQTAPVGESVTDREVSGSQQNSERLVGAAWPVPGVEGLSFDIVRPPKEDEIPLGRPWDAELYVVTDPQNAFVYGIQVDSD
jgi:hypothetical protein